MSFTRQPTAVQRHPMFRAMVVMGNGIAVGCGGVATDERAHPDNGNGKDAGSSGSSSSSTGGISGTGGRSFIIGTGGTNIISGTGGEPVNVGTGGVTTGSGGATAVRPACLTAQWDCSTASLACGANGGGWSLPNFAAGECACNGKRPKSEADCAANQTFVCRSGTADAGGNALPAVVPFECSCVPVPQACGVGCDTAFGDTTSGQMRCEEPTPHSILCGCAYVVLR